MGLEDIMKALEEEGRLECEEILNRAKAQAQKILDDGKEEADKIKQEEIDKVAVTLVGEQAKILNTARLFVKREVIKAKEEEIEKVFTEAGKRLKEIKKTPRHEDVLRKLIGETLENVGGKVTVRANKEDAFLVKKILDEMGVDYNLETDFSCLGGIEAVVGDGSITLINTFESRLEKAKNFLKTEIATILFGG